MTRIAWVRKVPQSISFAKAYSFARFAGCPDVSRTHVGAFRRAIDVAALGHVVLPRNGRRQRRRNLPCRIAAVASVARWGNGDMRNRGVGAPGRGR
jgi:hypothetical protein